MNIKEIKVSESRRIINQLKRTKNKAQIEILFERLLTSYTYQTSFVSEGQLLYRLVKVSEKGNLPEDFSYPPEGFRFKGRCNDDDVPVFYGANSTTACLNEQKGMKVGDQFRLGTWKVNNKLHTRDFTKKSIIDNVKSRYIDKFINHVFTSLGNDCYQHSIVLSEMMFNMKIINDDENVGSVKAIQYPSTIPTTKYNELINLAIAADFSEKHLELVRCFHGEITQVKESGYDVKTLYSCMDVKNAQIRWVKNGYYEVSNSSIIFHQSDNGLQAYDEQGKPVEPVNDSTGLIQR